MSSPARDARLLAIARGFTQVIGRGYSHIVTRNPTTGKCSFDGQVGGGWHHNGNQETDTAWASGVAPWSYQMVKANYNLFALSQFNQGQIIKWLDPASGRYVAFQPMALQWTNSLNQIQQISMPQSVVAQVSDDVLYWPAGYGAGLHFKYVASPTRLNKLLIIDSAASLPATSYDTLELNFIMSMSSGVTPYIDSGSGLAAWDKKTTKDTVKAIEFRLSGGAVVWSFAIPTAYDSAGESTTGVMRLKKSGSSLYVSVRFPKSWISAVPSNAWPIYIDPTVGYQVGASGSDGFVRTNQSYLNNSSTNLNIGRTAGGNIHDTFFLFSAVTIPDGATIDSAVLQYKQYIYGGTPVIRIFAENATNPAAPTTYAEYAARSWTTAYVQHQSPYDDDAFHDFDMKAVIEELMAARSYATGSNIHIAAKEACAAGDNYGSVRSYDSAASSAGKISIVYTEAVTSSWAGTWGG